MVNKAGAGIRADFRSDINGLRAWAVVAVILYHFGIPGFGGGFVGVDVFFVISGFLMTGIVVKGLERGTFSVMGFYMARGRRIVPALVALCAVLLVLGWFVLLPPDYKMLSTHSVYAMSFLSNVEFWQEAGYFDVASHEKWLLHTWSLSVEWQFYLILPLVLWAVWRLKPGRLMQTWAVGLGLVASLAASVYVTSTQPSAAFYLLHTRAWEMLAGGLVFLLGSKLKLSVLQQRRLASAGLVLITLSVALFDKDTSWPSWRAMLPVAAAMMVLLANHKSFLTASWLPQWLGDRSYSLYLWHWPMVVALTYLSLNDNPWAISAAILLTVLAGHLSYAWVETTSRKFLEKNLMVVGAGGLVLATVAVATPATLIWKLQGVTGRFPTNVEFAASEGKNSNLRSKECHISKGIESPSCLYGGSVRRAIVLGDSHANSVITAVAIAQNKGDSSGVVQWSYSGCPYVPGVKPMPVRVATMGGPAFKCSEFLQWTVEQLAELPTEIPVILVSRYAEAALGGNEKHLKTASPEMYFSKAYAISTPEFIQEFSQHITQSACQIAKRRTVYMVRPIPEMGFDVPKILSRRMMLGVDDDLSTSIEAYRQRNDWVWAAQDAARDQCGIKILDPTPYLCRDGRCYGSQNGRPLYVDDDHLSEFGNKLLVPMFSKVFQEL